MGQIVLLQGGIGDFLQCLPFIDANKKNNIQYCCVTHLKGAKDFLNTIGVEPSALFIFKTMDEQNQVLNALPRSEQYVHCPRTQYFDAYPFDIGPLLFTNGKPTICIHVFCSAFCIVSQMFFCFIIKYIPERVIKELKSKDYNLMVFGLEEELKGMGIRQSETLKFVCDPNPAKSLGFVGQCRAVIGSDSGIKTMSSMNQIPTFVWLGDYRDEARDQNFIDPYIKDGVMKVFRYKDVEAQFERGMTMTKEFLNEVL
jgi:hypothetical protein